MTSREDMELLFECMFRISNKILIVEIEDPKKTWFFSLLLHKRYMNFLKDAWHAYLSQKDFHTLISDFFWDRAYIQFSTFKNINGTYMIAEIEKLPHLAPKRFPLEHYIRKYQYQKEMKKEVK